MADPTTSAIQGIADVVAARIEDAIQIHYDEDDTWVEIEHDQAVALAGHIVAGFTAHFEHRDGLRRVVLTGSWEVDPAAVRNTARPDADRVAEAVVAILTA